MSCGNVFHRLITVLCIYVHMYRYEGCLSALNRLVELRRDDWRVAHNRAVAQYLLSNLTKTDEFRRNLITIEQQFERDAECSGVVVSVVEKSVLLFNLALIHQRVCTALNCTLLSLAIHLLSSYVASSEH